MSKHKHNGNGNGADGSHDDEHAYLAGEIRDALLTHVRSMKEPWEKMSEREQREKIVAIESTARSAIRNIVAVVSRRGFDSVPAIVGKFGVDGRTIKGTFESLAAGKTLEALADHQGAPVQIVLADAQDFYGERQPAKVDPDEPSLPIDEHHAQ